MLVIMMSEKRFKLSKYVTPSSVSYFCDENGRMLNKEVVKVLNEQQSIIDEQKIAIDEMITDYKNLEKENEQLKNDDLLFFQQVFNILMKYQHLFNREMADEVLEDLGIELTEWFE